MKRLSVFLFVLTAVVFVNPQLLQAHSYSSTNSLFLACRDGFDGTNSVKMLDELEANITHNICMEENEFEEIEEEHGGNNRLKLSYHVTLRDEEENIINPSAEVIDPANLEFTTKQMGFKELEDLRNGTAESIDEETLFGSIQFANECGDEANPLPENPTFEESPSEEEEGNHVQIVTNVDLVDAFVNFNDDLDETGKEEGRSELEEWHETIIEVADNEEGSVEIEQDAKVLANNRGSSGLRRNSNNNGGDHPIVFDSCDVDFTVGP